MTAAAERVRPRPASAPATGSRRRPAARLVRILRTHAGRLTLAVAAGVAAELATLALMATAAWLIARAAQQPPLAALSLAIVGVRAFATSRGAFRYAERLAGHDAALRALATLRGQLYDALVPLAPSGLPAYRGADLLSRMVSDVEAVQDLVVRVLVPVGTALAVAAVAVGFSTVLLPSAGAVLAAGLVLAALVVPLVTLAAARRNARLLAPARAELSARNVDLLEGSADLAVLGGTADALSAADAAARRLARVERRAALSSAAGTATAMLVQGATTVLVTVVAMGAAADGTLEPVLVPVVALTALISFEPMMPMVGAVHRLLESRAALGRILAVLDTPAPVGEPVSPRPAPGRDVTVELDALHVRYPDAPSDAVDGVDLRLGPGTRVAMVGVSGSGKSTLLAAMMRFIEPSAGQIRLNGHDVREFAGDDVRAAISGVTQDAHLFHTTIRENLLLAAPEAGDEQVRAALATARLLDWVDSLPSGLDTVVGASGAQVSGGQRQRLALARALLGDPPVVLLDEPTEGLDPDTADELVADLLASTRGRSAVLVTHRLDGLDGVDEIVVLDAGRVVQRGTHRDLVARPGPYQDLWWSAHPGDE
ncbi:ATP-binding cassette subfamily C protein/ATP-binding cassette subfamily C protein CydC [Haloactinopolyspora alba]|uniref:ATP-binding cassette subfamily C protein/ATP-binding cassette subfamily C protein CydC n=1 Tax=Haloactinopolyspora alba TaxID=648780 RepID=A0A2P8EB47_9ACTN|nr:thiol reductant ABC exporter subunit CydC [Haloactinopolyspora alba]PSL06678.1 ATP-binding cassette subfamily C protein/ATP-binding cassette subfamily C protein CydC [Haloactinopolyspora alba]